MFKRLIKWFKTRTVYVLLPNGQLWKSVEVPKDREVEIIQNFVSFPVNPERNYEYIPLYDSMLGVDYGDYVEAVPIKRVLFTFETQYYGGNYAKR